MTKTEKKAAPAAKGNWIVSNLVKAAVVVGILIAGAIVFLNVVTKHNQEITVPDFSNLTVEEASAFAKQSGMRVEVTDSVFVKRMKKGAVYRQNPKAGSQVKKGRRILITINAMNAKKVDMPDLIGFSMRQATAELQSRGLVLGNLIYQQDMATDNVLAQRCGGRPIAPEVKVETGTVIDLVVGLNEDDNQAMVPDVFGMKCLTATDAVHGNSLNVRTIYDSSVKDYNDSLMAVVYKQVPQAQTNELKGSQVTMYLTIDEEKVMKEKILKEQLLKEQLLKEQNDEAVQ